MNGIKPDFGVKFDDKYDDAKTKLIDFVKALDSLDSVQQEQLAQEYIVSMAMAASFEHFAALMRNGGQG